MGIFIFGLFGGFGIWLAKEEKLKGFLLISIGIGVALGITLWGINKSNCMNGSKVYGKQSMTYSNGKVSYYTPRTHRAIYCDEVEGYNFGYVLKVGTISFIISFGSLYGGFKLLEEFKNVDDNKKKK